MNDFFSASQRWRDWLFLAWYDFKVPYQRTFFGPIWQMLQVAVWVLGLTIVFSQLQEGSIKSYIAYVTCGYVFFSFISGVLTTSPSVFLQKSQNILNISIPLFMYIYQNVSLNIISLFFQIPVVFIVIAFTTGITYCIVLIIPALLIYLITATWITLLFAILGTRFRDLKHWITSCMRLLFFFTPIIWMPAEGSFRETIAFLNPISYFLEIIRAPFLGNLPSLTSWSVVIAINCFGILLTAFVFFSSHRKIPFWL